MGSDEIAEKYLSEVERRLRIRDEYVRKQLLNELRSAVVKASAEARSIDDIKKALGSPGALARKLSDPSNWIIDMGGPMNPKVPIRSFLSASVLRVIFLLLLLGMGFAIFMLILPEGPDLSYSSITVGFCGLWGVGAYVINRYLGYLLTASDLHASGMKVEMLSGKEFTRQVIGLTGLGLLFLWALGLAPLLLNIEGGVVSIPLAAGSTLALSTGAYLMMKEGRSVLNGGGKNPKSGSISLIGR